MTMNKFGVEETPSSHKLGDTALDHCPVCGAVLQKHGAIVLCQIHGSKPFENDTQQEK